jgi:two-component system response regulator
MVKEIKNKAQSILLVEDSEDDFYSIKRSFEKANLSNPIEHALSGELALEYLNDKNNSKPGLILLDLNMPGLSGLKTLEIIKQNKELKKIPVVILTTSDDDKDIQASYALGANTYIQKPVDLDGLFTAIKKLKEYWFEIALLPKGE